jgi:large subunit ribosomal protein L25
MISRGHPVSTRPVVSAEPREVVGKKVSTLRRKGILPAVVYGGARESENIQLDAREFDVLMRTTNRNTLVDLKIGRSKATPVLLQGIHEHPVRRNPMHVDFLVVSMTEAITVEVPVNYMGDSTAADKLGGTLLHLRESVSISALATALPSAIDLDITPLDSFEAVLHVSDLIVPEGVTILTDPEEPLARVQPPRVEEEPVIAVEGEELEEGAEVPEGEEAAEGAEGAAEGGESEDAS